MALAAAVRPAGAVFGQQPEAAPKVTDEPGLPAPGLPDEVAQPGLHFFTAEEMVALRRLADVLIPKTTTPGAVECGAPEFLDFYLARSDRRRQELYRQGLGRVAGAGEIEPLFAPLREAWTPQPPADAFAAFLRAAKEDLWRATVSSRAWATAIQGRRRGAPAGSGADYWYPVE